MSRAKLTDLDKTIAVIEQKIDDGFKQNSKEHEEIFTFIEKIDERKAGRWVEKFIIGFIAVVMTAFLSYVCIKIFGTKII